MGFKHPDEIRGENPGHMYEKICAITGTRVDMCMQYVFGCAVYFVSNANHDPELLKWWNWKDRHI
jgi:hypothetical protein